ncbi:MAG TPA: TIGR04282 family arsenosugar biosynthesis glycosyltransferase [Usitatibacter sp.]|nr:TIGR04282 family arsenosugar biosynthesis glycosyltransferase [Usitatibacter sp.]
MTSNALRAEPTRVAVFAKAPVPGQVKTRLAALLGDDGSAALHAALTERALATAAAARLGDVELWCAPDTSHAFFRDCAERFGAKLRAQPEGDLGARMNAAFERAHAARRPLIVTGSDCPALTVEDLCAAADALATHDAAFVPAEDGGYVLVALARPVPGLFDGIDWGTGRVMEATRERLQAAGARGKMLRTLWDVDRPEDYARLQGAGLAVREALS